MSHDILFALWFFLPAGTANVTPILVAKLPGLRSLNWPLDGGLTFRGKRVLGDHKTWRGLVFGLTAGILALWLQVVLSRHYTWVNTLSQPLTYDKLSILVLGFLLGFGALLGDSLESFAKRQLNIASGRSWFPFDQLDYIVGGLLLSSIVVQLPAVICIWVVVVWCGLHLLFSYLGYLLKLKDQPI